MPYTDPYYWSSDIQRTQAQQKALGQTTGLSPTALSNIIASDYTAQAEEQRAAERYGLAVRQQNLSEQSEAAREREAESANTTQRVSSIASGVAMAPLVYKSYQNVFGPSIANADTIAKPALDVSNLPTLTQPSYTGAATEGTLGGSTATGAGAADWSVAAAGAGAAGLGAGMGAEAGLTYGTGIGLGEGVGATAGGWTAATAGVGEGAALAGEGSAWGWLGEAASALAWVLCSELVRQGRLKKEIVEQEWEYVKAFLTNEEYWGYRLIADPLIKLMQKSRLFTSCIAPLIRAFAYEMASRVNPDIKGNRLGRFILWAGLPICRTVYAVKYRRGSWLKHLISRVV